MKQRQASIRVLHDGIVAPLTKLQLLKDGRPGRFDGGVYTSDRESVLEGLQEKQGYENVPIDIDGHHSTPEVTGKHLFGGMLQNEHFGHFMVESTVRLWALAVVEQPDSLVFYSRIPGGALPSFASQLFKLLGFQGAVSLVDRPTSYTEIWVPSPQAEAAMVWGYKPNRELFQKLREVPPGPNEKVYVSRSRLSESEGAILFEERIEQELSRAGYMIVHPQEMSLRQQISIYNGARDIIFSEGSAVHLYAFVARPDQRIFVVWRRRVNGSFLAQLQSFGGSDVLGASSVKELWFPTSGHHPNHTVNGRTMLDFDHLFSQLHSLGFIDGWSSAVIPSKDLIERKLLELKEHSGRKYELYRGNI